MGRRRGTLQGGGGYVSETRASLRASRTCQLAEMLARAPLDRLWRCGSLAWTACGG
jgi:hypothetical protein